MLSNANWPIRVGGEYYAREGSKSVFRRVTAVDANTVHYKVGCKDGHPDLDFPGCIPIDSFRAIYHPEDQSPIPELVAALEKLRERVQYWAENPEPDEWILKEWVHIIDDALAKAAAVPVAPQTAPEMREEVAQ